MFRTKSVILILIAILTLVNCTGVKKETEPPAVNPTEPAHMVGTYQYMADAGLFTACATGNRFPVAMEEDNASLEQAYMAKQDQPGEAMIVSLTGRIELRPPMEGEGMIETLIVTQFEHVWPTESCEKSSIETPLFNTYWKLVALKGTPVETQPEQRQEVHLKFQPEGGRVSGFAGCNNINGSYQTDADNLNFGLLATTMMACPQLDQETAFLKTLESVKRFSILGESLVLSDDGAEVARFKATELE